MPTIYDNINKHLVDGLNKTLETSKKIKDFHKV